MSNVAEAVIGHNSGDDAPLNDFEKLQIKVNNCKAAGGKWLEAEDRKVIADQETADKLATFLKQSQKLRTAVTAQKKLDKQPVLDEAAEIETNYKKLVATIVKIEDALKPRLTVFEVEKQRKIDEAREKREAEALRLRTEAAAKLKKAEEAQSLETIEAANEAAEKVEEAEQTIKAVAKQDTATRTTIGGRASGLKKTLSAEIVDYDAALKHYANTSTIKAAIQAMADASARGVGVAHAVKGQEVVPGVTMKITESV